MAIQDDILAAKQNQQKIPVYVVPDDVNSGKASYGNERVGLSGPGAFQFPGKNVYSPFAPGTKTLGGRQQELNEQKWQEELRQISVAEQLAKAKAASAASGDKGYKPSAPKPKTKTALIAEYKDFLDKFNTGHQIPSTGEVIQWDNPVGSAMAAFQYDLNSGYFESSGLNANDIRELKTYIQKNLNTASKAGADMNKLKGYDAAATGDDLGLNFTPLSTPVAPDPLKSRPWWQKTIDILPGKQYR